MSDNDVPVARRNARTALDISRARSAQAEANRAAFPFAKRTLDEMREYFPAASLKYAREPDGREIGKPLA